jgi:hypothetical protein
VSSFISILRAAIWKAWLTSASINSYNFWGLFDHADGALHSTIRTVNTTYAAAIKNTTHPKTQCRKPYAATQHLMLLMMCVLPEICRAKKTSIKLPCCIKLAFQIISVTAFIHQISCLAWMEVKLNANNELSFLYRSPFRSWTIWVLNAI